VATNSRVFSPIPGNRQVVGRVRRAAPRFGVLPPGDAGVRSKMPARCTYSVIGDAALVVQHPDVGIFDELVGVRGRR